MALTTVSFTTAFNFGTKKFNFTDTTDYGGQGIDPADVAICFTNIIDPTGNVRYSNTDNTSPDIDPNVALTNNLISLLLDNNGDVVLGTYSITASYHVDLDTLYPETTVTKTYSFNITYQQPTVTVVLEANCITPLLKSTDTTNYTINGVTPTITRVHTIFFPAVLQLANLTGTGAVLQTSSFYTNEHSSEVVSTLTYAFTGYTVIDVATGTASIDVECDAQLCDLYCCMAAEWNRYLSFKTTNKTQANIHLTNWMKMMDAAGLIGVALTCGKTADINNLTEFILNLGNCQVGCGCTDGDPVPVTGLGGLGSVNVAVTSCNNNVISVTSSTAGGVTTYQVCLVPTIVAKINASYNTTLIAGSNITITSVTVNGNIEYTVNADTQTSPNMITILGRISYTAANVATFTLTDVQKTGTIFNPALVVGDLHVLNSNGTDAQVFNTWKNFNNYFKVDNFFVAGSERDFKVFIQAQRVIFGSSLLSLVMSWIPVYLWGTTQLNQGELFFRFTAPDQSTIYANSAYAQVGTIIEIAIVIHE